jgi:hypothetical protein
MHSKQPFKFAKTVTLLSPFGKVPGSNSGRDTECTGRVIFFFTFVSAVGIATGYGLDEGGVGVRVPVGAKFFSSPRRPHRIGGPSSLLSNGHRGRFPRWYSGRGVKLTSPSSAEVKNGGDIPPLPVCLHGIVLT